MPKEGQEEAPVVPSAVKHRADRAIQDSCHPEHSEGSAQRSIGPAGSPPAIGASVGPAAECPSHGRSFALLRMTTEGGLAMPKEGQAKASVVPSAVEHRAGRTIQDSCRAERSEASGLLSHSRFLSS